MCKLHTVVVLIFVLWFSHLNYETSPVCTLYINTYIPVIIIYKLIQLNVYYSLINNENVY